jgi:lipopolysaccharide transport system ATP-binding protein
MPAPDFIIIGTQKGGTTSLYNLLVQHPQIHKAARKEVHYFDQYYEKGFDWYCGQFPSLAPGNITGEASPFYMAHPCAAERMAAACPNARLIVMLRNPADRAISHYQQEFRREHDTADLERALKDEDARTHKDWQALENGALLTRSNAQRFSYRRRGYYARQLQPFFQRYPRTQIYAFQSEVFFNNPLSLLPGIYHFLGVDPGFRPGDWSIRKPGHYEKSRHKHTYQALMAHYAPENEALFTLIGERYDW